MNSSYDTGIRLHLEPPKEHNGNLKPVAVINSVLEEVENVKAKEPYLQITSSPWIHGKGREVPSVLLERPKLLVAQPR